MFTILFILSVVLGIAIAWMGWFGQKNYNGNQRPRRK